MLDREMLSVDNPIEWSKLLTFHAISLAEPSFVPVLQPVLNALARAQETQRRLGRRLEGHPGLGFVVGVLGVLFTGLAALTPGPVAVVGASLPPSALGSALFIG